MQNTKKTDRVDVLLFPRFSNHCLANTVEPMRAANEFAREDLYNWRFLSFSNSVRSSSGLVVATERLTAEHAGQMLIVMPSYGFRDLDTRETRTALRRAAGRYDTIAGFDTGAWLLARAGLLNGRAATIHWDEFAAFAETFAAIDARPDRFVLDGNRITCGGAESAFELVLNLIQSRHGAALRINVGALFLRGQRPDPSDAVPATGQRRVDRAIAMMRQSLESPMPLPQIANSLRLTLRGLELDFQRNLGMTPRSAYRLLRLEEARRLVDATTLSVAEIAVRCGWETPSAMTRAFRERYGVTPRALRAGRT